MWTIAFDGQIGYFKQWSTREAARREATVWRKLFPNHRYQVVKDVE